MNTTISDAAVSAACMVVYSNYVGGKRDYRQQCDEEMRDALEAALPHIQPAKPEAVRLRDKLRERAEFEAWARPMGYRTENQRGYYSRQPTRLAWDVWQAALAATGKQQVGADWSHIANEWADAAANGVQWLRNIRDGASTVTDALACMESNVARIQQLKPQQVGEVQGDALPTKDAATSNTAQGLYRKFEVSRNDGSDKPGGKHHGCEYFVLDMTHDPHAKAAANAYAESVQATHPQLAAGMRDRYALDARQPVGDGWSGWATQYPGKMPVLRGAREIAELNHYPEEGQRLILLSEQHAQAADLGQTRAIEMLLTVAEAAYNLADNANDMEDCENIEHADFVALSDALDALDALDELPDNQPGYTMSEPAKARWALRGLIDGKAVQNG